MMQKYVIYFKNTYKKQLLGILLCIFLFSCLFMLFVPVFHHAKAARHQVLNFVSVSVQPKDTLWSIAKKYYTEEYGSVNDYVKEIKRCNSLTNDYIRSGSFIIVPIYVSLKESKSVNW